jgi:hypothetical protein
VHRRFAFEDTMTIARAFVCTLVLCGCHPDMQSYPPDERELAQRDVEPGDDAGPTWQRGVAAQRDGDHDAAVRAFVRELTGRAPVPSTGARLLQSLPHSDPSTRRATKRRGRRFDPAGFEGVSLPRIAMAQCGGRPVERGQISCGRDPPVCTYRFHCEGGGVREIAVGSRELWFGTQ